MQYLFAEDAILAADFVCAEESMLEEALDRTVADLEQFLCLSSGVDAVRLYLLIHRGSLVDLSESVNRCQNRSWGKRMCIP